MKAWGRAKKWVALTVALCVAGAFAWMGFGGASWLASTGDIFAHLRLQAAPQFGQILAEPVELLARPRLVIETAAIHPAEPSDDPDIRGAVARSRRLVIDKPVISIDIGSGGRAIAVSVAEALEPIAIRLATLDMQVLTIRDGLIKLHSSADEFETLSDVDVQITPHRRASATVAGQLTFRGQRLKFNATVAKPAAKGSENRWPTQATLSSALFEARFDGAIGEEKGLRLTGAVDLSAPRLREVARWVGMGSPQAGNLEALRLKGALDWTGGAMAFSNATLTLDGNEGVGAVTLTRTAKRTAVEGTLAFKRLNLTPYVVSTMVERTLLAPIFAASKPPVIASLLDNLDADLRISSDALVIPGIETGQGAVAITLKNGKLLAEVAELAIEDGVFKGQLSVERVGSDPRYALNGKLDGVEAGRLLQRSLGRNPLQGRADATVNLVTSGDTSDELLTRLGGKAKVVMREGGRLGLDLRTLIQSAKRAELRGWQSVGTAVTGLDVLSLTIDVQHGVVHTTIAEAKSGTNTIFGSGYVDLHGQALEFSLGLRTADPSSRVAPTSDALRLSGPWQSPILTHVHGDNVILRSSPALEPASTANRR
jgi:AsmA protein